MPILHRVTLKNKKGEAIFPQIDDNIIIDQDGNMNLLRGDLILSEGKIYAKIDKDARFESVGTDNQDDRWSYLSFPKNNTIVRDSATGALKITIPQETIGSMIKFKVSIFTSSKPNLTDTTIVDACSDYVISGCPLDGETNNWTSISVYSIGSYNSSYYSNMNVSFAKEENRYVVYIGNTNSHWTNVTISISDISVGINNTELEKWNDGWSIDFTTSLVSPRHSITNCAVYYQSLRSIADGDGKTISSTYLKLTGGTITGSLNVNGVTTLKGRLDTVNIEPKDNTGNYTIGSTSYPYDKIYANTFVGDLNGNATTANSVYLGGTTADKVYLLAASGTLNYLQPYTSSLAIKLPTSPGGNNGSNFELVLTDGDGSPNRRVRLIQACPSASWSSGSGYTAAESITFLY